jgi:hypothetical protein
LPPSLRQQLARHYQQHKREQKQVLFHSCREKTVDKKDKARPNQPEKVASKGKNSEWMGLYSGLR